MIDQLLSLVGLGQAALHRAEDRNLKVASQLAEIEATIMQTVLRLDFEIQRLGVLAADACIDPDMAVSGLQTLRLQCDQLTKIVNTNRSWLGKKGANVSVVCEIDRWAATCSVIPVHVDMGGRQIEAAISQEANRR
jgi:hypothetical protein